MLPLFGEINTLLTLIGPGGGPDDEPERDLTDRAPRRDGPRPVMIVESDRDILETLTEILEYEGHRVISVGTAEEAVQRLQAGPTPGLILLELVLPGMSGWGLAGQLQRDPALAGVPIVVVSGALDIERQARSLGMADCVTKPVQVEQLLEIVDRYCR
ncbi:MAG: response regulator [Actinomycetota bacterium]